MAFLLNIDTATEHAGVCLSNNGEILAIMESVDPKNHASFVQPAIQQVMAQAGQPLTAIDAVAVTGGPGSYTGLRVGLSTAKGLCFALKKPLIMVNTLEVMAFAVISETGAQTVAAYPNQLYCPMIDARRMEVFTALYNSKLQSYLPPTAMVLDENSFIDDLKDNIIVFSGSGSEKGRIITAPNAQFSSVHYNTAHLAALAEKAYKASLFVDIAYSEPFYLKEFYKHVKKN